MVYKGKSMFVYLYAYPVSVYLSKKALIFQRSRICIPFKNFSRIRIPIIPYPYTYNPTTTFIVDPSRISSYAAPVYHPSG